MTTKNRVLIVSDVRLYREGLERVLCADGRLEVVNTVPGFNTELTTFVEQQLQVALVDTGMAGALDGIRQLSMMCPSPKVVGLAVLETAHDIVACAEAGVTGFVTRDATIDDLVKAVEGAILGEVVCSARVATALLSGVAELASHRQPDNAQVHLTRRELQIVEFIDRGRSNKEIAVQLCIELPTVKNHVHNILCKLGVHSRAEAAAKLRQARLIPVTLPRFVKAHIQ